MKRTEGRFTTVDGLELYYQQWHPDGEVKAGLLIVHGLGARSGWFENVIRVLLPQGIMVYEYDLRGHGRSPGQRGHIESWQQHRQDLHQCWQLMRKRLPNQPCFIMGHSLGGVIVLDYVMHSETTCANGVLPPAGMILMAPAIGPVCVRSLKLLIGRFFSRIYPRFTLNTGICRESASRDPAILEAYAVDDLRHSKGTARLATEFIATTEWIRTHLSELQLPTLVLQGSADAVTLAPGSRALFDQLQMPDKQYRLYEGGYHDLHNDLCAAEVAGDMATWLSQHVAGKRMVCKLPEHSQVEA